MLDYDRKIQLRAYAEDGFSTVGRICTLAAVVIAFAAGPEVMNGCTSALRDGRPDADSIPGLEVDIPAHVEQR